MATNGTKQQQQLKKNLQKCLDRERSWSQYFLEPNKNKRIISTLGNLDNQLTINQINEEKKKVCIKLAFVIKIINNAFKQSNLTKIFRMQLSSTEARLSLKNLKQDSESFSDYEFLLIQIRSLYPEITIVPYFVDHSGRGYTLKVSDNINLNKMINDRDKIMFFMSQYRKLKKKYENLLDTLKQNIRTYFETNYVFGKSFKIGKQYITLHNIDFDIATGTMPQIIVSLYFNNYELARNFLEQKNFSVIDNPFQYDLIDPYKQVHMNSVDVVWKDDTLSKLNVLLEHNVFPIQSGQKNKATVGRSDIDKKWEKQLNSRVNHGSSDHLLRE